MPIEVPVGKYCWRIDGGVDCEKFIVGICSRYFDYPKKNKHGYLKPKDCLKLKKITHETTEFYKSRVELIEKWKSKLPEPYLTECCNILANCRIKIP